MTPLASPARAGRVEAGAELHRGPRADALGERRSTVPSTDGDPRFTGRDAELGAIDAALRSGRVAVIHGPPGLGKSRLAMEYAHLYADAYPGGTFFVRFDQPPPTDLAKLLRDLGKPAYADEPIEDQCRRALREVGNCHVNLGQFAEALSWFERAIAAKEQGDVYERVDRDNLGKSLHGVGECHARLGRFAEALAWFERAVAAKERGDMHGRVDHDSLGESLHEVANCHVNQGRLAEALPWFERAVAAKEQGDMHGRMDHDNLGKSLHGVGDCHANQSRFAEALPWFDRAVATKERGDVHGCVDSASLAASVAAATRCHAALREMTEAASHRIAERSLSRSVAVSACGPSTRLTALQWP